MPKSEQVDQRNEITAVKSAIQVIEFLAAGDILGYRSLQEISTAVGISKNRVWRILSTLISCHWAEKTDHGFRLATDGLIKHLVYAQNYLSRLSKHYGVKTKVES
jgi:DNA-binding IclR family transcriptional regulator